MLPAVLFAACTSRLLLPAVFTVRVAYKNASKTGFDSLSVKVVLYDSLNNAVSTTLQKVKPAAAGDTIHVVATVPTGSLEGLYNLYLEVNPNGAQYEQESFNNFLYKWVYVMPATTLPVTLTEFNAQLAGADVKTSWTVPAESGVKDYVVQHSSNGSNFKMIGKVNATNTGSSKKYEYIHQNAPAGKNYYRLVISNNDGSLRASTIRLIHVGTDITIAVYPNPVKDRLVISSNYSSTAIATVTLVNSTGQRLLQQSLNGTLEVDMSKFASGHYILQVNDGKQTRIFKVQKQ